MLSLTKGSAAAGYVASSGSAVAALPFVELGAARSLGTPRVRVFVNGTLGVALPEVAIDFAGHQVAAWGRPVGSASLGLEVDLF